MERYFCWPCCGHKHVFHVKVSRHTAHSAHPIKSKTSHTDMGHVAPPVSHVFHRLHGGIASQPWGTWRAAARPSRWRARRQHKSTSGPFSLALPPPTPHTPHNPPKGGTGSHFAEANSGLGPRPAGSKGDRLTAIGVKEVTRAFHAGERARALELRAHRARRAARAAAPRTGARAGTSPHSTGGRTAHGTRATARGAQAREAGSFKCYSRVVIRSINPCFKC